MCLGPIADGIDGSISFSESVRRRLDLLVFDEAPNSYLFSDAQLEDDPPQLVIHHYPVPVAVHHLKKEFS